MSFADVVIRVLSHHEFAEVELEDVVPKILEKTPEHEIPDEQLPEHLRPKHWWK